MWQKVYEKYKDQNFVVVGLALDTEGIKPAKLYYDKYKVTYPSLVDPNYATKFTAVPKTFFVDEHGVVKKILRSSRGIERLIKSKDKLRPVTDKIRAQWSNAEKRLSNKSLADLLAKVKKSPKSLEAVNQLASRYLDLNRTKEAHDLLMGVTKAHDPLKVALSKDKKLTRLLSESYFQLSRALKEDRKKQVKYATLCFYLNPSIGYAKQIARLISPEKFDGRPRGDFDNRFREDTRRRLYRERQKWLKSSSP